MDADHTVPGFTVLFSSDNHRETSSPCDTAATSADRSESHIIGDALSLPSLCPIAMCADLFRQSRCKKSPHPRNLSPMGPKEPLSFTGRHSDSLSRHGSFEELSPSVVQSSRALQRRPSAIGPHDFPSALFWYCGADCDILPRGLCFSGFTFVPEEVKYMEKQLLL